MVRVECAKSSMFTGLGTAVRLQTPERGRPRIARMARIGNEEEGGEETDNG